MVFYFLPSLPFFLKPFARRTLRPFQKGIKNKRPPPFPSVLPAIFDGALSRMSREMPVLFSFPFLEEADAGFTASPFPEFTEFLSLFLQAVVRGFMIFTISLPFPSEATLFCWRPGFLLFSSFQQWRSANAFAFLCLLFLRRRRWQTGFPVLEWGAVSPSLCKRPARRRLPLAIHSSFFLSFLDGPTIPFFLHLSTMRSSPVFSDAENILEEVPPFVSKN